MFEKILEKILLTYFGRFITGFDKTNLSLGVWSGNIVIENVSLKSEIIDLLQLPFKLKFSSLGRMILKVPWNKLSSAPVEVILEDILIVLNPLQETEWKCDDSIQWQSKLNHLTQMIKKQLQKIKTKKDESQSYLDKLTLKIIDNLQLQIKNIHFRYEDSIFSWGIKLDCLEAMTTDNDFHISFIDRSLAKNKQIPRNKLIQLKNLQFYWNMNETLFLSEFTPSSQLITDEVIRISAYCKMVINSQDLFEKPLYELSMELESINVNLKHSQLKQMITVLEAIQNNKKFKQSKRKLVQDPGQYQNKFIELFSKYQRQEYKQIDDFEQSDELKQIIASVELGMLIEWNKIAIKQIVIDQRTQQLQKQKSKKGWFTRFRGNADQDEVSQEELQEIETFIEDKDEKIIRPLESLKLKFSIKLQGAKIQLVKDNGSINDEGILQILSVVAVNMEQKQGKDFRFEFLVQSIGLQLLSKQNIEQICKPTTETKEFLKIQITKASQPSRLDLYFLMQSINCNYNPSIVRIIREITDVKQVESTLKAATWDKIEQIQDTTESKLRKLLESSTELSIDAQILSPTLYLPFSTAINSECWLLKMDSLQFKSNTKPDSLYETFDFTLYNGCFEYHPDKFNSSILHVVKNYSARLEIGRLKSSNKHLMKQEMKPLLMIKGKFEPFNVILNEKVYKDLIYLPETIFPKQHQQQTLQQLQLQKQIIIKQRIKQGNLLKCGALIRSWSKNYVILSGSDLYFYDLEQSLMANSQLSIYNSHVNRVIMDDQLFVLKITNRQGEFIFACDNEFELEDWINKINLQIREYASLDETKKKKLLAKKQSEYYVDIQIQIKKIQIKMYKETHYPSTYQEYLLFLFKLNGFLYSQQKYETKNTLISIDNLSLQDWVFDYENPQFQDLMVISSTNAGLIINVTEKGINNQLDQLQINWKPDSFLKIRELIQIIKNRKSRKWYFSNIRDYEVDQLKRGSNCDYEEVKIKKLIDGLQRDGAKCLRFGSSKLRVRNKFQTLVDCQNFLDDYAWIENEVLTQFPSAFKSNTSTLLELESKINFAKIQLFHRTTHTMPYSISIDQLQFSFKKLQFSNFLDCRIHDVKIHETTNYPHSVDSNFKHNQVIPNQLIGKRGNYDEEMLRIRFGGHDEFILANKDRTVIFLLLEFNPVVAMYQQQPIMRLIDYIINQIVSLLREPEALTMNTAFIEQKRRKSKRNPLKAKRAWGDVDFIQSKFICPTFLDLRITLNKPLAIVKGWPQFETYFQLDAEIVQVYNVQKIDMSRLLKEGGKQLIQPAEIYLPDGRISQAWAEAFCIEGRNMQLQYVEGESTYGISTPMNFNLSFERLLHCNEVNEIYDNVKYDRSIRIRSSMTPIVLQLYRKQYLEICKMIFHNFTYDDQNDRLFIHDFEVARSFEPAPISFWLDFEEISIFALSSKCEQPLIQVHMNQMRLEWLKGNDIDLNLFGKQISMYHYDEFNEIGFVVDLRRMNPIKSQGLLYNLKLDSDYYQIQDISKAFNQYEFKNFNSQVSQFTLLFHINKPSGDKDVNIRLKDVKMVVEPTVFANIGLWSKLEQPCWPPQVDFGDMPAIKLIVELLNNSLCLQSKQGYQILATKGDISYVWNRSRIMHPEKIVADSKSGKLDRNIIDYIGDAFEHKVNLKNLELFKCLYEDFINYDLGEVHKRHILLPFSLFFCIKNELQFDFAHHFVYFTNKFQLHVDKTICKFSYQDLVLILGITEKLQSSKTEIIREPIYGLEPEQLFVPPVNNIYDAIITGLQVVVINDAGEAYVPVFDLTLSETQLQFQQTNQKSIFSTVIRLSSTFYNPKIAIWEPIVESCIFSLDVSLNPTGDPQKIIFLEMTQQKQILNINISAQMISVFHKTFLSWQKEIDNQKKLQVEEVDEKKEQSLLQLTKQQSQQIVIQSLADFKTENIDHVSPYTIRNESGFTIEVEDRDIRKYVLKSGYAANFQIDSEIEQVFAQQNMQRLVQIRVMHPEYQFNPICNIDLDSIRVTRVAIKPINKDIELTFMLFIEVVPKDTRKLLLISSEMIIFNKTNQSVELKMFTMNGLHENDSITGIVESMRAYSVPFDRTRSYLSFRFQGTQEYCKSIDLYYLSETVDKVYEQFHSEMYYTLVKCSKRNVNQTLVYLEPPFQIKNCLPLDIAFELYGDSQPNLIDSMVYSQQQQLLLQKQQSKQQQQQQQTIILEKAQYENLIQSEKGTLLKQEIRQISTISSKGRLAMKIKLPFYNLSDMSILHIPQEIEFLIEAVQLCDYRGNSGQILVDRIKSTFFLYTPIFAVNELPQKIFLFSPAESKKLQPQLLAGQRFKEIPLDETEESSRIVILGNRSNIQISNYDNLQQLSEIINLNYTGNQTIKLINEEYIQELGYNLSLVCVDKQKPLVTKVLTISPRFVIINQTMGTLNAVQVKQFDPLVIESQQRKPFYWRDLRDQQIIMNLEDDQIEWDYSNPINPNSTGFSCFTLRAKNNVSIVKHMNCVVRVDNQIIYLIVLECRLPPKLMTNSAIQETSHQVDPPYIIVNHLNLVTLICYQYCCQDPKYVDKYPFAEYKQFVNSMNQAPFSWEFPNEKRELVVQVKFEGDYSTQYQMGPIFFNLEEADAAQEYLLNNLISESEQLKFYVISTWEGSSRKLKFLQDLQQQQDDRNLLKLDINLSQVGISLLDVQNNRRVELIYVLFKGVELNLQQTSEIRKSELRIKYINVDYNTSYKTMFPVIFTPTKYKEIFEYNRPHLALVVEQSTQVNSVSLIKNIKACLQPSTVRLTSEMLEQLYTVFKQISQSFKANIQLEEAAKQFDFEYSIQQEEQLNLEQVNSAALSNKVQQRYGIGSENQLVGVEWESINVSLSDKATYINKIEIYPLQFNLTFYNCATSNQSYNIFMQILKTIGIVLANIDEAPIKLDGIYLENSFDTTSAITTKLITHYKDMFIQLLLKVLGSIEILGNPVGLVKHLARGIYDLFDKPIEGFIKGPIEGGIGITKGVGSLVQNTVSGTFNSTSKIAGSISGGLAAISMDDKYKSQREQLRVVKPRQFFGGVYLGSQMLGISVQRAIFGVVDIPVQETKRDGVKGTVIGALKGSTGFFIKPFSGMFDFICKTTDGVKATAQYWDDKANERRERDIRILYQNEQFYKAFNERDANLMAFLANINIKYSTINYFDSFEFGSSEQPRAVVLSIQNVIYLDMKKKKTFWIIDPKQLNNVVKFDEGVLFQLRDFNEKLKTQQLRITIENNETLREQIIIRGKQLLKSLT